MDVGGKNFFHKCFCFDCFCPLIVFGLPDVTGGVEKNLLAHPHVSRFSAQGEVGPLLQRIVEVKRGAVNKDTVLPVDGVIPA